MKIGYAHVACIQEFESGVVRYGRALAKEASRYPTASVLELDVPLTGAVEEDRSLLEAAGSKLAGCDLVHIQYSPHGIWAPRQSSTVLAKTRNLRAFYRACPAPIVCTLHDVVRATVKIPPLATDTAQDRLGESRLRCWRGMERPTSLRSSVLKLPRRILARVDAVGALRQILQQSAKILVMSHFERTKLNVPDGRSKVSIIHHYAKVPALPGREAARQRYGVVGRKVVTVLGFILPGKGHALAIDALAKLPDDTTLIFAGGWQAKDKAYLDSLNARARKIGVGERIRITGFLSDEELAAYIACSDVALCPFVRISASGTLTNWLAAGTPIVASDLPQTREYSAMLPGAIRTFSPYCADALADLTLTALKEGLGPRAERVALLQQELSPASVLRKHMTEYAEVLASA